MKKMLGRIGVALIVLALLAANGFSPILEKQVAYAATLTIEQNTVGNIFYENEIKSFKIHTDGDSIDWAYTDYWNNTVESGTEAVNGESVTLTVNPGKNGWFNLVITAKQNGSVFATKDTTFAVVANFDLSQVADSPFSVQTHAARTDEIAQDSAVLIPIARKMGVKYVRDALRWGDIEDTVKGVYNFKSYHDDFLSRVAANDLKPYMTLALYNPLYDGGLVPTSPEARAAFAEYGKQLLNRYPDVGQVEIWNEPDIPSFGKGLTTEEEKADFYFNLLKTSYEQIHPAFPNVKITGFVFGELGSDNFLKSLYEKGALNYMDEYSFHSYTRNPEEIVKDINRHKTIMKTYNNNQTIPMNLSETGFTNFNFDEYVQANYTVRRLVTVLANGIKKVNVYNLQNKTTVPNEFEGTFGLIRNPNDAKGSYTPKPAYAAYAAMTRQLSGASFQQSEDIAPGLIYIHAFKKGSEDIRVMYSPMGSEVRLHSAVDIEVTDMMGNTQTHTPVEGVVRLHLDKDPIYVKGTLSAPVEEIIPVPSSPIALYHGYYTNGGYTEVNGPLGTATNKWVTSSVLKGYDGKGSRAITNPTGASATWKPTIATPGRYRVSVYLPGNPASPANTTRSADYSIYINGVKASTKTVDQYTNQGTWMDLGIYDFPRSINNYVLVEDSSVAHDKPLRADVVKFELIPPTGIDFEVDSLQMGVGNSLPFTPVFTPTEATDQTLVWSSSNSQVATVNEQGIVSAIRTGDAVIRATNPLTSLYAEVAVQVNQYSVIQPVTLYSSYGANGGYSEVNGPLGTATNKWVTSTVLKGYNGGISRAITNPTGASAQWTPTVSQPGRYRISVYLPGTPATPVYTTKAAEYSIYIDGIKTDSKIIDQSTLQGSWQLLGIYDLPYGSTSYITVVDANAAHDRPLRADVAKFEFIPPTSISLDTQALDLHVGDEHLFAAGITPIDATEQDLVWSSTNSEVAAIDVQGQLRALTAGSTVIRVTNPLTSLYAEAEVTVRPLDQTAPVSVASVSPAAQNGSNGWYTSDVTVNLTASDDLSNVAKTEYQVNNGDWITFTGSIPVFGEGIYKVDYRSTDQAGNVEQIQTIEFKIDKTAPSLPVQLDKTSLWPANHKMVTINTSLNSSDATSGVASVVLTSITSNEPDSGQGDIQANIGAAATTFSLRAERSGNGMGRIYTITYTATDKAGNKTVTSVTVTVPHDQSENNNQSGNH